MELELGLALPDPGRSPKASCCGEVVRLDVKKRCSSAGFGHEGGDERRDVRDDDCETPNKRKRPVGWPPVKCALHSRRRYVKVKMEGAAIGRKLDVSLHGSYDDLRRTLDRMFFPSSANNNLRSDDLLPPQGRLRRRPYVVTYEDREGDWLLVGDVPWEAFAKSVRRLKILSHTN